VSIQVVKSTGNPAVTGPAMVIFHIGNGVLFCAKNPVRQISFYFEAFIFAVSRYVDNDSALWTEPHRHVEPVWLKQHERFCL
jgi:hypothetical protein